MGAGHSHDHSHGHSHGHAHGPASHGAAFAIGVALNLAFVVVEATYGFLSGSMAKVLTLLAIVGILMLRPQGLFALKVRK